MPRLISIVTATAVFLSSALAVQAGNTISDQRYQSGKYAGGAGGNAVVLANCPREYRDIYRGSLYCRNPAYQVLGSRHPTCPEGYRGMYRGSLYCFGRD